MLITQGQRSFEERHFKGDVRGMRHITLAQWLCGLAIGFILVLSPRPAAASAKPVTVGYVAIFKGLDLSIDRTHLPSFTHFNLSFANPDADGVFVRDGAMTCMIGAFGSRVTADSLKAGVARLKTSGAKVLISVAGGIIPDCSGDWKALLAPDRREATAAALVALADQLGLDGVDIDLEGELLTAIDRAGNYVPFIETLSKALKARGKLLTCATGSYEGGMIPVGSIRYFDLVNVMSYDAIGPFWGPAGAEHSPLAMAERDLDLWLARGVAPERLVLGVPFYGYGFGGEKANWSYRDLVAAQPDAAKADVVGKACAGCRYVTHNGPATIEAKAKLARARAGGVMVWEVSQDSPDHALTRAIHRGLSAPIVRAND
ncbi:glycosyl hydrolase family 18 [Sphingomonas koreensis]|nr:glycosyl hydrolase family 18 [Sphingomonas koreensis]RSU66873.1 glycosyl hydrolase family 18 [Sphingomonas koreensis]